LATAVSESTDQAIADRVLHIVDRHQELWVEPKHRGAVLLPKAVIAEVDLPDSQFDRVAEIWDRHFRRALADSVAQACELL
jgi:hypothetical protein